MGCTASTRATDPITSPATANGIIASQMPTPAVEPGRGRHVHVAINAPARNTSRVAGSATTSDTADLLIRYARGDSADNRSCRFQPVCRSMATRAPALMVAPNPP